MAFRPFGGRRNPIVDLPRGADAALEEATAAIVTSAKRSRGYSRT